MKFCLHQLSHLEGPILHGTLGFVQCDSEFTQALFAKLLAARGLFVARVRWTIFDILGFGIGHPWLKWAISFSAQVDHDFLSARHRLAVVDILLIYCDIMRYEFRLKVVDDILQIFCVMSSD